MIKALVPVAAILTASCGGSGMSTQLATDQLKTGGGSNLIGANNRFGFDLFKQLADGSENVFISPASVAIALHMTLNGAAGDTETAMRTALSLGDLELNTINEKNRALLTLLQSADPKVQTQVANSLWARLGVDFRQDFVQRNRDYYRAEISTLDFSDPKSVETINRWVHDATSGKIPSIIDQIADDTVMYLINAVYFKGLWTDPFKTENTRSQPFHLADGNEISAMLMSRLGEYDYLQAGEFQAIRMPYGEGRMAMYVFLPTEGIKLSDFIGSINADRWSEWIGRFRQMEGVVSIPRFRLEYSKQLKAALSAMGMGVAFTDRADLGRMRDQRDLYIQHVQHKTFVEVNEEGTEAAAVTDVPAAVTSMPERFEFTANRPFFYAIHDRETNSILFMGVLTDPR